MKKSWSGTIKLGFVSQPVAVYSAADSKAKTVSFHQLHACGGRINLPAVCRTCQTEVDRATLQRGYEYEKGKHVVISDDELKSCEVSTTKIIDLQEFVPASQITPLLIAESHFVTPINPLVAEAFVLIREALSKDGMAGIATLAINNKEKLVALVPYGKGLILHTLRHASELRDANDIPVLDQLPEVKDQKTVALMRKLIQTLQSDTLNLEKYPNRYVENVQALIKAKLTTPPGAPVPPVPKVEKADSTLEELLKASLASQKAVA